MSIVIFVSSHTGILKRCFYNVNRNGARSTEDRPVIKVEPFRSYLVEQPTREPGLLSVEDSVRGLSWAVHSADRTINPVRAAPCRADRFPGPRARRVFSELSNRYLSDVFFSLLGTRRLNKAEPARTLGRPTSRLTRPCRRAKPAGSGRVEPQVRGRARVAFHDRSSLRRSSPRSARSGQRSTPPRNRRRVGRVHSLEVSGPAAHRRRHSRDRNR
jgi:hypothetical protein